MTETTAEIEIRSRLAEIERLNGHILAIAGIGPRDELEARQPAGSPL